MLNKKQIDIIEKVAVNTANLILGSLTLGSILSPKGFNLIMFVGGSILFLIVVGFAILLRKGDS